jgi:hypothetical protein
MKLTLKRSFVAAAVGIAAVVTPLALTTALTGVSKVPGTVAGATGTQSSPDQILYGQTSGTPANFYQYVPGNGSAATTQTVTPKNGNCGTPTISDPNGSILAITAKLYAASPSSNEYDNASSPATVGSTQLATGVCDISPAWSIENKAGKGAEALDFSPGPDTKVIGTNRTFTDAQIPIQRKDSGVSQPGATVQLVEFDSSGNQLASQTCTINGGQGTLITADTNGPGTGGNCTGATASFFQSVEVRNLTTSTSLSVVGPAATFTLGSVVCGQQTIQSTGPVSATLTVNAAPSVCKSYTSFSSGPNANGQETLMFNGFSAGSIPFTVNITWPAVPLCQPDAQNHQDPNSVPVPPALALPICAPHEFSFDNITYYDQAYCRTPSAPGPGIVPEQELCTANKAYNNVTVNPDGSVTPITTASNAPGTQITETWVGDIDWWAK